jgi:large subunit ribosomal protein L30
VSLRKEHPNPRKRKKMTQTKLAVVRVRGLVGLGYAMNKTFDMLNLSNKNWCVLVDDTPSMKGMLFKVKDYVTWGEVSEELISDLITKRAEPYVGRLEDSNSKLEYTHYFVHDGKKYKRSIRLAPPRKGYGRRGIKHSFVNGGSLGYRGDKINDLLKRMMD